MREPLHCRDEARHQPHWWRAEFMGSQYDCPGTQPTYEYQTATKGPDGRIEHETREARAQTVIGELEQQLYVQAERGFVRVVIADEEGTSFSAMRLAPEAAERAIRILTQAVIRAREIGSRDPA